MTEMTWLELSGYLLILLLSLVWVGVAAQWLRRRFDQGEEARESSFFLSFETKFVICLVFFFPLPGGFNKLEKQLLELIRTGATAKELEAW